jgi:3-oxoacyl-ACP reductase-like protein
MIDSISSFLNTGLVVALGVIGWIIKRLIERLDLGDKRLTKIEVELAAQRERDAAVESRMGKVESAINEMHNKLDRMMEILVRK